MAIQIKSLQFQINFIERKGCVYRNRHKYDAEFSIYSVYVKKPDLSKPSRDLYVGHQPIDHAHDDRKFFLLRQLVMALIGHATPINQIQSRSDLVKKIRTCLETKSGLLPFGASLNNVYICHLWT